MRSERGMARDQLTVLAWPVRALLVFVFVWKLASEAFRPLAGEPVFARLGHLHVAREEATIALAREDPEPLGRLLGEQPWLLARRHRAQKEARGEADRTRGWRDEVREVAKRAEIAVPALAGDQLGERRLAGHERLATALDPVPDRRCCRIERASVFIAGEQNAGLLEELTHRRGPERERRRALVPREDSLGLSRVHPAAASERLRRAVIGIDLAAGERVVAAEELHVAVPPDHVDLERLGRAGRRVPHEHDRRRRLRFDRRLRAGRLRHYKLISCATRSRWYVASPNVNSDDLARLK